MKFSKEQKELFKKNLNCIQVPYFREKLREIKEPKLYKVLLGKDPLDINFLDLRDNKKIYKDPIKELENNLQRYGSDYRYYKVLTFYGFGNGLLFKGLCQNPNLERILVFEREFELLYLIFHLVDFTKELSANKIAIAISKDVDYNALFQVFAPGGVFYTYSRTYFMDISTSYYEKFQDEILSINKMITEAIKNAILTNGNDPYDALQGISQYVLNLKDKLTNSSLRDLLKARKNVSKTAIIVSTGPSLIKQLPLLKEYRDKALIFCADSAYPILYKYGIKPDYVSMLERTELTAEFFNHDFGDFDDEIVFLPLSIVHPNAYKYLNERKRKYVSICRLLAFQYYMGFSAYGYLDYMSSVAHMNLILAVDMGCESVILIGQDLAYAENGNSHPDEYQNSSTFESSLYAPFEIEAYGGGHMVQTHIVWKIFKDGFETIISFYNAGSKKIKVYNATEGGLRINHTIEKPFKECCEELLTQKIQRPLAKIKLPSKKQEDERMLKAYFRILLCAKHCEKEEKNLIEKLAKLSKKLELYKNSELKEYEKDMEDEINDFDKLRAFLLDPCEFFYTSEILQSLNNQLILHLAKCYTLPIKNEEDRLFKMYLIFKENVLFVDYFRGALKEQKQSLLRDVKNLKDELLNRGFEKRLVKIEKLSTKIINGGGVEANALSFRQILTRMLCQAVFY